jgi:acetylornithine deacetylase/succinyl-diaminopimelate desuccinylase-like protein
MSFSPDAEVAEICRDLIRIDTSNYGDDSGPGERRAAEYLAAKLEEVGIEATILESAHGRANVLARWGNQNSTRPGLLIHGHLDVVPAEASDWKFDPFAAHVEDGYIHGRGAIDMKDFDAMVLSVVRARQRSGDVPDRPITLVFTADEEAGGAYGAAWLVENHPEWFEGCSEAIGEVGGFSTEIGGKRLYLIGAGEKGISWIRLRAEGSAGHGSMKQPDNAVTHLARALVALGDHEWPVAPGPSMQSLLDKVRELSGSGSTDPDELLDLFGPAVRMIGASIRNSTNSTMLEAGYKHNVVPAFAEAAVDARYLPGQAESFVADIQSVVGDSIQVRAEVSLPALEYPFEGDLVDAMTVAIHSQDPGAHIAPFLWSGGTDTKAWSRLGIGSFGFAPLRLPPSLDFTALFHGVDERVPIDALEFGARVFDEFLTHA